MKSTKKRFSASAASLLPAQTPLSTGNLQFELSGSLKQRRAQPDGARRLHNFSAGPSALRQHILEEVQDELLNYQNSGASFIELSHRDAGGPVQSCITRCTEQLETLLDVPSNYSVLFFQGGAHAQFAAVPLNLARPEETAGFGRTGFWSDRAKNEAANFVKTATVFDCEDWGYKRLPRADEWKIPAGAPFVHLCANETIHGLEYLYDPDIKGAPLILDATSTLLSRQLDVSKYGAIFASSGKNLGPSGLCTLIVRDDLLEKSRAQADRVPSVLSWSKMAESQPIPNIYNTPPTFNFYMLEKVLDDYLQRGGLRALEENNTRRAEALYELIDASGGFYSNRVEPASRSRMNVPFRIGGGDTDLEQRFTVEAEDYGLMQVFGHPLFGGQRITLYNNIENESVDRVFEYMRMFMRKYQ